MAYQSFPREPSPRHNNGLTNGSFSKPTQNGYNGSSPLPSTYIQSDFENAQARQSPPVSSVNAKTSTSSRWIAPQFLHDIVDRNELIFRRVRGILNKVTPEKFDKLSRNLINIGIDSKTILKGVIILIFEKAIDEPKYCGIYAQLCQRLSKDAPNFDEPHTKTNTFLRLLLSKCQEEFETRSKATSAFDKKDGPLSHAELHGKEVAKRKMLGNLKFIGELGKFELLQEAILHKCIQQLLAKKKRTSLLEMAEDIECLCQIVSTVGKRLDTSKAKNIMDQYFDRMNTLSRSMELPSRIRFMLQDVIELRHMGWQPRITQQDNGPRSVTEMRWEMMGPVMPPNFPFMAPGMSPHGVPMMQSSGNAPWLNDPLYTGGMPTSGDHVHNPADDHTDIFGKTISSQSSTPAKQQQPVSRLQAKPDLFEPHYLKSKGAGGTSKPSVPSAANGMNQPRTGRFGVPDDEKDVPKAKPPINKNNPWNIDPFVPHYNKPAVSMLLINNEQAAKSEKTPTPPMKTSPQTIRAYALSTSSSTNKLPPKKNGEISLRPSSFLSKKEEKPKTIFAKSEELPAKMQQFTNLTINDKTNKSNRKTALTKVDIDNKISEVIGQHKGDNDADSVCIALQSLSTNIKYSKMVAKQLMYFGASSAKADWKFIGMIFVECVDRCVLSVETTINAFTLLFDDSKVMELESGKEFVATFASMFVINDMISFARVVEHFQDGHHYPTVLLFLEEVLNEKGKDWLERVLRESKTDLRLTFPKDSRSDSHLMGVAQEKNLVFVFPHLCLKEELLSLMCKMENEEYLIEWLKENVEGKVEAKLLIHMIVCSTVTMATKETLGTDLTQKPEKEIQESEKDFIGKFKNFLKEFIGLDSNLRLEAVYALQVYCHENNFPKEMLLRLFIIFYNMELIDEDVFLQWKEDINETYPGKGKSLFQVNNWLQWLETADEEDEAEAEEA